MQSWVRVRHVPMVMTSGLTSTPAPVYGRAPRAARAARRCMCAAQRAPRRHLQAAASASEWSRRRAGHLRRASGRSARGAARSRRQGPGARGLTRWPSSSRACSASHRVTCHRCCRRRSGQRPTANGQRPISCPRRPRPRRRKRRRRLVGRRRVGAWPLPLARALSDRHGARRHLSTGWQWRVARVVGRGRSRRRCRRRKRAAAAAAAAAISRPTRPLSPR